jgi:hypothetical protein
MIYAGEEEEGRDVDQGHLIYLQKLKIRVSYVALSAPSDGRARPRRHDQSAHKSWDRALFYYDESEETSNLTDGKTNRIESTVFKSKKMDMRHLGSDDVRDLVCPGLGWGSVIMLLFLLNR